MAEEKKYEITEKELTMYIGLAMAETIPQGTALKEEKKLSEFAADLCKRTVDHLNGSKPFSEAEINSYHVVTSVFHVIEALSKAIDGKTEEQR